LLQFFPDVAQNSMTTAWVFHDQRIPGYSRYTTFTKCVATVCEVSENVVSDLQNQHSRGFYIFQFLKWTNVDYLSGGKCSVFTGGKMWETWVQHCSQSHPSICQNSYAIRCNRKPFWQHKFGVPSEFLKQVKVKQSVPTPKYLCLNNSETIYLMLKLGYLQLLATTTKDKK